MNIDPEQIKQAIKLLRDSHSLTGDGLVITSHAYDLETWDGESLRECVERVGKKREIGEGVVGWEMCGVWIAFRDDTPGMPNGQQEAP